MENGKHVLVLAGTRPEAVKMAPVIHALRQAGGFRTTVCATGQHREMLAQAFADFDIEPDINLDVMTDSQSLASLSAALFAKLDAFLAQLRPDWLLVQGDTTTVMVASLCAFYRQIKIGHVEAGLRSFNRLSPFPEEINRRVAALVANAHFAPTADARQNLLAEGVSADDIIITGNTVVDALRSVLNRTQPGTAQRALMADDRRKILVTAHRRENHGKPLQNICKAILELARERRDVLFIYPVHLNPAVRTPVHDMLGNQQNILLLEPLDYRNLLAVMEKAELILTDSGGIQEEGCVLRKPVLILRDTTERMEGVKAGASRLIGADRKAIVENTRELLDNPEIAARMSAMAGDLYGDGHAAERIVAFLSQRENFS